MIIINLVFVTIMPALAVVWFKNGDKIAGWMGVTAGSLNFLAVFFELLNLGGNYV